MNKSKNIKGNAIVIVLVAIALLAALTFAVTQNSGGSHKALSSEQAVLNATEIISYGSTLKDKIEQLALLEGISDINTGGNGVLFSHSKADTAYGTPDTQPATEIFNPLGGQITYKLPRLKICLGTCAYEFSGQYAISGIGSSKPELAMLLIDIDENLCKALNKTLGNGWTAVPQEDTLIALTRFNGINYSGTPIAITGASNEFLGKKSFCYQESGGGKRYIYVHVLRQR